ncbi:MAG: HlyD family efflux transporter periplasmic adaptor subunit [Thermotogae bacterium]|nr:HlyD family efflux transporter periplasmic adaptor subunit [Thermotogota bacterium]
MIVSDVLGTVERIYGMEGERVSKGDTLAIIYRGPAYNRAPIISPVSGRVALRLIEEGQPVKEGMPLFIIERGGRKVVKLILPLRYRSRVKVGYPVIFEGKRGRITRVARVAVPQLGGVPAEASVPNVEVGDMGVCYAIWRISDTLKIIPSSALRGDTVFKVVGGKAEAKSVEVKFKDDRGNVGVIGDLKAGDTVVVLGVESLKGGERLVF